MILNKPKERSRNTLSPSQVAQLVGVSSRTPKGCGLISREGTLLGWGFDAQPVSIWGSTMSAYLSSPPPAPLLSPSPLSLKSKENFRKTVPFLYTNNKVSEKFRKQFHL